MDLLRLPSKTKTNKGDRNMSETDQKYIDTIYYIRKNKDRDKLLNIAQNAIQQIKHINEVYGQAR